jgi:four helix bundle protein
VVQVLGKQLLRSGTSVGAHYREARRAGSRAEFVRKIEGGLQELEETMYWLELLTETAPNSKEITQAAHIEAKEILAIMVASAKTAKLHR